jgi:xanthine/CO dehydrogenase XdhC/CoxF family maturation factor
MKEIRDILRAYEEARQQHKKSALATVVHVDGSSYRRPGARMLITIDGQLTGAISGGCLEGDALRKALLVMAQGKSMLVTYDTMDDDDATLGIGLGCNGIIQVLIEPIHDADPQNPIAYLKTVANRRQNAVLITLFSLAEKKKPQPGTCLLLDGDGHFFGQAEAPQLNQALHEEAALVMENQTSSFQNFIGPDYDFTAFIEFVPPPVTLVIIGAGNDILPLVDMADVLGWETRIADGRANYARPERFAKACQVLVARPEQVLRHIIPDDQTVFVLMTHNFNYDKAMLAELLQRDVRFVGMLGPKKKLDRILGELKDEGVVVTDRQLESIYGPVGLDIGAETPEEIALSILAEIKAVLAGRKGQPLRDKQEAIHPREETMIYEKRL